MEIDNLTDFGGCAVDPVLHNSYHWVNGDDRPSTTVPGFHYIYSCNIGSCVPFHSVAALYDDILGTPGYSLVPLYFIDFPDLYNGLH